MATDKVATSTLLDAAFDVITAKVSFEDADPVDALRACNEAISVLEREIRKLGYSDDLDQLVARIRAENHEV